MTFKEILTNTKEALTGIPSEKGTSIGTYREKEIKTETGFDAWINVLEEEEQPEACEINNPDCENCGS